MNEQLFAPPRDIRRLEDCHFYHTVELPEYGVIEGDWDLRRGIHQYLGNFNFAGKRVLEIGTASGFCCFWMERRGADIVAYDLNGESSWDVVPFAKLDTAEIIHHRKIEIDRINNSWWLSHRALGSNARVVYGSIYDLPDDLGKFDVSTLALVLSHLRDPFFAMTKVAQMTKDTMIIVGVPNRKYTKRLLEELLSRWILPGMQFWPDPGRCAPWDTYWYIPAITMKRFLAVLGFENGTVTYHTQIVNKKERMLFTIIANRTIPLSNDGCHVVHKEPIQR